MAVEVLLMADVADLGQEGDVVSVADGYARNYLLPKKIGAPVTDETRRQLEKLREQREADRKTQVEALQKKANELSKVSVTITVKTGDDDKMYGSVTQQDIIDALKEQSVDLDKHDLLLDDHIKELGVFDVKVKLDPEVESTIKVWVVEE